jgi:hypothetical protein
MGLIAAALFLRSSSADFLAESKPRQVPLQLPLRG